MISIRLRSIASFLSRDDRVLDIGCDHGYLGIYVTKEHLVSSITLTDIRNTALNQAKKNIEKENLNIPLILSDGLYRIDMKDINTIVISGMGSSNILKILKCKDKLKNVNKLILQSNNNLDKLRKGITNYGYQLVNEITIKEKDIWYVVCLFIKNNKAYIDDITMQFGILKKDKILYYKYLYNKYLNIYKNLPIDSKDKKKYEEKLRNLDYLLKKGRIAI